MKGFEANLNKTNKTPEAENFDRINDDLEGYTEGLSEEQSGELNSALARLASKENLTVEVKKKITEA